MLSLHPSSPHVVAWYSGSNGRTVSRAIDADTVFFQCHGHAEAPVTLCVMPKAKHDANAPDLTTEVLRGGWLPTGESPRVVPSAKSWWNSPTLFRTLRSEGPRGKLFGPSSANVLGEGEQRRKRLPRKA